MSPRNTHVLGAGAQGKLGAAVQLAAYSYGSACQEGMPLCRLVKPKQQQQISIWSGQGPERQLVSPVVA